MFALIKFLIRTAVGILFIFAVVGFFFTYRTDKSASHAEFIKGAAPAPALNGFYIGLANFYTWKWRGKEFSASNQTGVNVFLEGESTTRKFPFKTSVGPGSRNPGTSVLKLDYDTGTNPFWMSPILDEVVETAPGKYLGIMHYRLIPGYPFSFAYFRLTK